VGIAAITGARCRTPTREVLRLASHFLFDYRFCRVRWPIEKGHVEAMVKFPRRNFRVPVPEAAVVALAADANILAKSGRVLTVGQLTTEFGFTDADGRQWPPFLIDPDDAPHPAAATVAYPGLSSALRPAMRIRHRVYNGAVRTRIAVERLPRWPGRKVQLLNRLLDAARSSRMLVLPAEVVD
jgi:hypothetical protein